MAFAPETPETLARQFLTGDATAVIESVDADSELASAVCDKVIELMAADVRMAFEPGDPLCAAWHTRQRQLIDLYGVGGVDRKRFVETLVQVVWHGIVPGVVPTVDPRLTELLLAEAPDHVRRSLADGDAYAGSVSVARQLWELPGEEGDEWFVFLLRSTDAARTLMDEMAFHNVTSWNGRDWRSRMRILAAADFDAMPKIIEYHNAIVHAAPISALPEALAAILRFKTDPADLQHVALPLRKRLTGMDHVDAQIFPWSDGPAEVVEWLAEATVGAERFPAVRATAERLGLRSQASLSTSISASPPADVDASWEFSEVRHGASVDVPSGLVVAADWLWLPEIEDSAWQVVVQPGRHACRVALAAQPLQEPVIAATELVVSEATAIGWEELSPLRAGTGYVPPESGFGIFAAEWVDSVLLDEDRIDDDSAFEAVVANKPEFAEIEAEGMRAFYMFCAKQHPTIRSWRGVDRSGDTVSIVSSFEVLDFDPVRDGRLPWD